VKTGTRTPSPTGQAFGTFDWDQFDQFMTTNVRGPILVAEAFVEHVKASDQKKIINNGTDAPW
jgi:NAD(P)-dependent dehydrogenase (short-subunit alcohol dehydrogenase family)